MLTLSTVLQFATCSEDVPILGYALQPSIEFPEVDNSFLPKANTCICRLYLSRPSHVFPLPSQDALFDLYDLAFATDHFVNK